MLIDLDCDDESHLNTVIPLRCHFTSSLKSQAERPQLPQQETKFLQNNAAE